VDRKRPRLINLRVRGYTALGLQSTSRLSTPTCRRAITAIRFTKMTKSWWGFRTKAIAAACSRWSHG